MENNKEIDQDSVMRFLADHFVSTSKNENIFNTTFKSVVRELVRKEIRRAISLEFSPDIEEIKVASRSKLADREDDVIKMILSGDKERDICKKIGIAHSNFMKYRHKNPSFEEKIKSARLQLRRSKDGLHKVP